MANDSLQKKRFQPSEVTNEIYVVSNFNFSMKSMLLSASDHPILRKLDC